jgi:Tfp pilus assembly protein PilV
VGQGTDPVGRGQSGIRRLFSRLRDDAGFALLEVVVSSIVVLIVAGGVFTAMGAATRSTAEERHRAVAHGLAQADLSRMRSLRISDLANLNETNTITQDGTPYTVVSRGEFITDATGTASCQEGVASADYIKISSTVTWPSIGSRTPVVDTSIVSPPNGSVSPNSGALAVSVEDSQNVGIPGVGVNGTGPDTFSGTTGPEGCVVFGNLPAGNYTLTLSGVGDELVEKDGNPPQPQTVSVVGESTNTVVFQADFPGTVPVSFTTKVGSELVASSADSVVVFNSGMTLPKAFWNDPEVGRTPSITASGLFPFSSDYSVYAGSCPGDNPNPNNEDPPPFPEPLGSVVLPAGGNVPVTIQLPALHLSVTNGAMPIDGAHVRIIDQNCPADGEQGFVRDLFTTGQGTLQDPGLPFSDYTVCADDGTNHHIVSDVSVKDLDVGTSLTMDLATGAQPGVCP